MGICAVSLERTHVSGRGPSSGEAALCVGLLCSLLAAGQLVEQVLVKRFILVLGAGGQKNVASDVLMHDFAIRTQAGECNGDVLVKLDSHLPDFPVYIPLFHITETPGFNCISRAGVHPNQSIVCNSNKFFFFAPLEPCNKVCDAEFW